MEKSAVEWLEENLDVDIRLFIHCKDVFKQAKEIEKQQKDEFVIEFSEWKDINCIYYDGWNIRVPLGDKYNDIYTNKELLEIYKKENAL
jgi:hypothetical protein